MEGKIKIGKVTRLHGYKGELSLKIEAEYAEVFNELEHVFLELNQKPVPFFIDEVRYTAQGYALVFFEGVDNQAAAEKIRGAAIWIEESELTEDFYEANDHLKIIGYEVHDQSMGFIGKVAAIVENPGQDILIVDHEAGEVLIPMTDHIVKEVKEEEQTIQIEAPEGLIDLNLE